MNRIEVKDKDSFTVYEDSTFIINSSGNYNFKVDSNSKVFIYLTCSSTINFDINSDLDLSIFSYDTSLTMNLNLNKDGVILRYGYSTFNNNDNKYIVNIYHNNKDSESYLVNHGLNNKSSKFDFIVNSYVYKESINVITKQDNKIIVNDNNNCLIEPNLLIDNDSIEASHSAFIGQFNKDSIFYLLSRGLNMDNSLKLLSKSFLIGNLSLGYEEKNLILDKLDMHWR